MEFKFAEITNKYEALIKIVMWGAMLIASVGVIGWSGHMLLGNYVICTYLWNFKEIFQEEQ